MCNVQCFKLYLTRQSDAHTKDHDEECIEWNNPEHVLLDDRHPTDPLARTWLHLVTTHNFIYNCFRHYTTTMHL